MAAGLTRKEDDSALRFWDVAMGKELEECAVRDAGAAAFSPDGKFLAAGGRDIRILDAASGKVRARSEPGPGP